MVGPTEGPAKTVHFGQSNVVLSWIWIYSSLEQIAQEKRLRLVNKPENLSLPFRSQDWLRKRQSVLRAVTLVTLMALSWIELNHLLIRSEFKMSIVPTSSGRALHIPAFFC